MSDVSGGEFRPFRSIDLESRIRHIENHLVAMSAVGERDIQLAAGQGAVIGSDAGVSGNIPEEDVDFDSSAGHTHDGDLSSFIKGTQTELNFGTTPTSCGTFTITDSLVTSGLYIFMVQSADAPTGRSQDENEMDPFQIRCVAGSGQFTAYINSLRGPVVGLYKFNYVVTKPVV